MEWPTVGATKDLVALTREMDRAHREGSLGSVLSRLRSETIDELAREHSQEVDAAEDSRES